MAQGKCKCCENIRDLRMGFCFDCVDCESIIEEGVDMWDVPLERNIEMSMSMTKVKYILQKFKLLK